MTRRRKRPRDRHRPDQPAGPPPPGPPPPAGFGSLAELMTRHAELVREVGRDLLAAANLDRVREFVRRAVDTGAVLSACEDRATAQDVIGFWTAQVATAAREQARADRKAGVKAATAPAVVPDFGNTLLRKYESAALVGAVTAAEQLLAGLKPEDKDLARLIGLRLVRLKPDAAVKPTDLAIPPTDPALPPTPTPAAGVEALFDPVPASRAALYDLGEDADVGRLVDALAAAGVLRVVRGTTRAADQIALAAADLLGNWPALRLWMAERVSMRQRAATFAVRRAAGEQHAPSPVGRAKSWAVRKLAKLGRWVNRRLARPRRPTDAAAYLLDRDDLAFLQTFQDRNADEQSLLTASRDWQGKTSDAYRVLLGFAVAAVAVAGVLLVATVLSGRKAWLEMKAAKGAAGRADAARADAEAEQRKAARALNQMFAARFVQFGEEDFAPPEQRLWAGRRAARALRGSPDLDPRKDVGLVRLFEMWASPAEPRTSFRTGHVGTVRGMEFSPDGRLLVTGGDDNSVQVWDVEKRSLVWRFGVVPDGAVGAIAGGPAVARAGLFATGHTAPVLGVAFGPDGRRVASASADNRAILWDLDSGCGTVLVGHKMAVVAVCFSPDGRRVATVGEDGTPMLWDAATGAESDRGPRPFKDDKRQIKDDERQNLGSVKVGDQPRPYAVGFSAAGDRLAVVRPDGRTRVWDAATGEPVRSITPAGVPGGDREPGAPGGPVVAFAPGDRLLAVGTGPGGLWGWADDPAGAVTWINLPGDRDIGRWFGRFAFTADGRLVTPSLTADSAAQVNFWNLADRSLAGTVWLPRAFRSPTAAALTPDGERIAVAYPRLVPGPPARDRSAVSVAVFHCRRIDDPVGEAGEAEAADEPSFRPTLNQYQSLLRGTHVEEHLKRARELILTGDYEGARAALRDGLRVPGLEAEADGEATRLAAALAWARGEELASNPTVPPNPDGEAAVREWKAKVDRAVEVLDRARAIDPTRPSDTRRKANELAAWPVSSQAADAASRAVGVTPAGPAVDPRWLGSSAALFGLAREWDRTVVRRDGMVEARSAAARALVSRGMSLVRRGMVGEAIDLYALAAGYDDPAEPAVTAFALNELCWWGCLWGKAEDVLCYGEKAVKLDPTNLGNRDTRGLARAMTGSPARAIADFEAYANDPGTPREMAEKRRRWVESLRKGENPFTEAALKELRTEGEPVAGP